jgi:hypothetical protein
MQAPSQWPAANSKRPVTKMISPDRGVLPWWMRCRNVSVGERYYSRMGCVRFRIRARLGCWLKGGHQFDAARTRRRRRIVILAEAKMRNGRRMMIDNGKRESACRPIMRGNSAMVRR